MVANKVVGSSIVFNAGIRVELAGINKVQFPTACKGTVETLIKGNCHANPAERLPMKKGGTDHDLSSGLSMQCFLPVVFPTQRQASLCCSNKLLALLT